MPSSLPLHRFLFLASLFSASVALANTAIEPAPREGNWMKRHEGFVAEAQKGGINVLFLGDSITDFWRRPDGAQGGNSIWQREFAPLGAANFGISGDRTQHVLWRLEHGEVDGIKPKLVVLMIGTNNTGVENDGKPRNSTEEAIEGVTKVVQTLHAKLPQSKILLLGIFPRADAKGPPAGSTQIKDINAAIAKLADGKSIRYLDITAKFLAPDGTLPKEVMPDLLHPNAKGYEIWAAAIKEPVAEMLK